ncbi:hypothetical protein K1719_038621 [Acacia pycnantha]|nr:hypothetical protein K1719_038621 [Acacia pycnantha]
MNKLREEYSSFKKLLSISGFGLNTILKTATTENVSLWDEMSILSGDNGVGNVEVNQISDGDCDSIDNPIEMTSPVLHRQEYKEDEHMLNEDLFASDPVETPSLVLHRQDRIPNAKRRICSGNKDLAMACQAIQDLVKIRQNQCHHNFANFATAKVNEDPYSIEATMDVLNDMVGLKNQVYSKVVDQMVESQAWRVAFIKAPPERRASLI